MAVPSKISISISSEKQTPEAETTHKHRRKFLAYLVILCFWEAVLQAKSCSWLKHGFLSQNWRIESRTVCSMHVLRFQQSDQCLALPKLRSQLQNKHVILQIKSRQLFKQQDEYLCTQ